MQPTLRSSTLLSPARLRRFGVAVAVAMVAGFAIFLVTAQGVDAVAGGRVGGDWAAFHTAGVLVREDPASLLDVDAQRRTMAPYLDGRFAPFPYPPLFGYVYVPFGLLSFAAGYLAYVVVLVGVAVVAIHWTMDLLAVDQRWRQVGMLGGLTFAGTFISIGGAQNTVLTLFLLVLTLRLVEQERPIAGGVALAVLWFKPQYAVPVLGLLFVAGHRRTVATALAGGGLIVALTTVVFGTDWPTRWLDLLQLTDTGNRVFNTDRTVSGVEWVRGSLEAPWGEVMGLGLAVVVGAGCAWIAWRRPAPEALLPLIGIALLVTAPHALAYELVLLVPAIGVITRRHGIPWGLAAWVAAPVLIADIPAIVRIAAVLVVGVAWLATVDGIPRPDHQERAMTE